MTVRDTSRGCYYSLKEEGIIGAKQLEVLNELKRHPDATDRELSFNLGHYDPNQVRPRRKELLDLGLVEDTGIRPCIVTQRRAHTWRAKDDWDVDWLRTRKHEKKLVCPMCGGCGYIKEGQQTL